jgi:predicted HTH transcriptional regulator
MSDDIQTTPPDNTGAPESIQPINPSLTIPTMDSQASEMPPVAPESPTNVVDMPVSKDDNGAVIEPITLEKKAPEITETPSSNTQTQTAQMGGNEPIRTQSFILGLLEKAKLAIQSRKRNKLDKIMNLFAKQTNITNDEVEKYLHVSDATATRYLSILEKEGKIKQNGKTGKGVLYTKL